MKTTSVGVRALKNETSAVLRRVRRGEVIVITDRSTPVALISPIPSDAPLVRLRAHVAAGRVSWSGGKPSGAARPPVVRGPTVAAAVIEDRR